MSKQRKTVGDLQREKGLANDALRNPGKDGQPGKNAHDSQLESTFISRHDKAAVAAQLWDAQPEVGTLTATERYQRTKDLLAKYPDLSWPSKHDQPIGPYQGHVSQLEGWKVVNGGHLLEDLLSEPEADEPTPREQLINLLYDHYTAAYKRPTPGEASTFDLVIGVVEGETITGICTRTIGT